MRKPTSQSGLQNWRPGPQLRTYTVFIRGIWIHFGKWLGLLWIGGIVFFWALFSIGNYLCIIETTDPNYYGLRVNDYMHIPFLWWDHLSSSTRILQFFPFSCKWRFSLFKPHWDYKSWIRKEKTQWII